MILGWDVYHKGVMKVPFVTFVRHIRVLSFAAVAAFVIPMAAQAQERSADGALSTQMTWSALSAKIKANEDRVTGLDSKVNQIVECNRSFMVYIPGDAMADTRGCVVNDLIAKLAQRLDTMETSLTDTNTKLAELDSFTRDSIHRLDTAMNDLDKRMKALEGRVDRFDNRLTDLERRMAAAERNILEIDAKVGMIKNKVDGLEAQVAENTDDIASMLDCGTRGKVYNNKLQKCVVPESTTTTTTVSDLRWVKVATRTISTRGTMIGAVNLGNPYENVAVCGYVVGSKCSTAGTQCAKMTETRGYYCGSHGDYRCADQTWEKAKCN